MKNQGWVNLNMPQKKLAECHLRIQRFESMQANMVQRFETMQNTMDQRFGASQQQMDRRFDASDRRFNRQTAMMSIGFLVITTLITIYRFLG